MSSAAPIFDPDRLDELFVIGALTSVFFDTLCSSFAQASQESVTKIEDACRNGDHDALYRAAHALKGSAATFGAAQLANRARDLEERGRLMSALPPVDALADLRDLARAAHKLAWEWAKSKGLTPAPTPPP